MHDCKGREIKVGDTVLVPFKVKETSSTEEYCNATLVTVADMYPAKDNKSTIVVNTKQTIRANDGDETSFQVVHEANGATRIK